LGQVGQRELVFLFFYMEILVGKLFVTRGEDGGEKVKEMGRGSLGDYFLVGLGIIKGVGKMLKSGRRSMGKIHRRIPCTGDEVRMPSGQCAKKTRGIHHRRPLGQGKNKMVPCKSNQHRSARTHRCVNNRTNSPRSPRVAY
jgi:hypothetical protein